MEFWYGLMRSAYENLSNSDFYTKIRFFSDQFWPNSLNSDFFRKFGPEWEACILKSIDKIINELETELKKSPLMATK